MFNKKITTIISLSISLTFISAITVPAIAAPDTTTTKTIANPTQKLSINPDIETQTIIRDTYSATSEEEMAVIKAEQERIAAEAAAEAARIAEEAAKVAEAERIAAEKARINSGQKNTNATDVTPNQSTSSNAIIAEAQKWVGVVPYGKGAHPSDSFMCDGFVQYVFAQQGINLPRGVNQQYNMGTVIPFSEAQAGDLVVWYGKHIAIYDGDGGYYHSPTWGKMVTHREHGMTPGFQIVRL